MVTNYKEYTIEVTDDPEYNINSVDNVNNYIHKYDLSGSFYGSQYGIRVKIKDTEISSAIVACIIGLTTHEHSFLIDEEKIFICCNDHVFALNIPELSSVWLVQVGRALCFGIYPFKNDLLVHGELEISRVDMNGNIKWQFSARDIFVTPGGEIAFEIIDDRIHLTDWEYYKYVLDENGSLLKDYYVGKASRLKNTWLKDLFRIFGVK